VILTEYSALMRDLKRPIDAAKLEQRMKQTAKQAPIAAKQ